MRREERRAARRSTDRLVGRETVLAGLERDLRSAAGGRLGVTLVHAAAGMGKSRVVGEFVERRRGGVVSLVGRGYPLGAINAMGVWVDAIEGHLRNLDPTEVRRLCGPAAADLAALLPSVAMSSPSPLSHPSRIRLLSGLARLLRALSDPGPLLVVIDDAHLADSSSWATLSQLAHQLADRRILIVLTARTVELRQHEAATEVVMALSQEGLLRREQLGELQRNDLSTLASQVLARPPTEQLTTFLVERSRGVPLFAITLLRALVAEGADLAAPALRSFPEDLTGHVRRQLAALTAPDAQLLELLAVVGTRVEFDVLAALATDLDVDPMAAIDRLEHQELIVETERDTALEYEFAHPLMQEAVYRSIGGARRRALHRRVARDLLRSKRPGAAAAHFIRSARPGDDEAIDVVRAALQRAEAQDDHRAALALLEALLDLVPAGDARWLEIADVMAWQTDWVVDHRADVGFETALRAMRRIEQVLESGGSSVRRAAAKFHLGSFLVWGAGDVTGGGSLIEEAIGLFEAVGEVRSALLARNELGYVRAIGGDHVGLASVATSVLASAQGTDRRVELQALCAWAHALVWAGELDGCRPVIERALRLAREDGNLYRTSYLLAQQGYERALSGDLPAAEQLFIAGRNANAAYLDTHLPDYTSFTAWLGGRLTAGVSVGREALAWDGGHLSRRRVFGACFAALCALELGADDEPAGLSTMMRAVFDGRGWWFHSALPDWLDAAISCAAGDRARSVELLERATVHTARCEVHLWTSFLLAELAEATVEVADGETLARVLAFVPPRAVHPTHGLEALERFVHGAQAVLGSDTALAIDELRVAVDGFSAVGWRLWEGRTRTMLGQILSRRDGASGVAELERALLVFGNCGADRRSGDVRRLLVGRGSKRFAGHGASALTPREREVAGLALRGAPSREIAARLFIGERTVESHLAHIYAKLGVRGRIELLRCLREQDL